MIPEQKVEKPVFDKEIAESKQENRNVNRIKYIVYPKNRKEEIAPKAEQVAFQHLFHGNFYDESVLMQKNKV